MPFPQTEIPGRLQAELAARGIRMTEQRRAILKVIETAKKHLAAGQSGNGMVRASLLQAAGTV